MLHEGRGSSSYARRVDAAPYELPLARLAEARSAALPRLRRGRVIQLESMPVTRAAARTARLHVRAGPGIVEGVERRPWRGRAGTTLRRWLEMDEDEFYATFYCASVTRCYPGRPSSGRGDRTPTPEEQELCAFWREQELRLLRPRLIVTVGGLAARRLLGLRSVSDASAAVCVRGRDGDPAPTPVGREQVAQRAREPGAVADAVALVRAELGRASPRSRRRSRFLCRNARSAAARCTLPDVRAALLAFLRPVPRLARRSSRSCSRSARRRRRSSRSSSRAASSPRSTTTSCTASSGSSSSSLTRRCAGTDDGRPPPDRGQAGTRRRAGHRQEIYAKLVRLSFGFYDRHQTGQLMSRATVDLQGVRFFSATA